VRVATRGGDELQVSFLERDGGWDVTLSGPVETSFRGEWNEAALTGAATEV
jgi:diaminopimelate epimerase